MWCLFVFVHVLCGICLCLYVCYVVYVCVSGEPAGREKHVNCLKMEYNAIAPLPTSQCIVNLLGVSKPSPTGWYIHATVARATILRPDCCQDAWWSCVDGLNVLC